MYKDVSDQITINLRHVREEILLQIRIAERYKLEAQKTEMIEDVLQVLNQNLEHVTQALENNEWAKCSVVNRIQEMDLTPKSREIRRPAPMGHVEYDPSTYSSYLSSKK